MISKLIQENLKLFVGFDFLILFFLLFFLWRNRLSTQKFILWIKNYFSNNVVKKVNNYILIGILSSLLFLVFLAFYFPLGVDESYTFLYFTQKGICASMSTYPVPNNHVLFSTLSNMFYPLAQIFNQPELSRCASLIIAFLHITIVSTYMARTKGVQSGLAFLIAFLVLTPLTLYSYELRGYGLFIFSGSLLSILIFEKSKHKYYHELTVILHFIGFATNPSWLYCFFVFNSIAWISNAKEKLFFRKSILSNIVLVAILLLFYSPIIIFYGADALINNPYVKPAENFNFLGVLHSLKDYYYYFCGSSWPSSIICTALLIFTIIKSKKYIVFTIPFCVALIMMIFHQYPFERIFVGILSFLLIYTLLYFPKTIEFPLKLSLLVLLICGCFSVNKLMHHYFFIDTRMTQVQKKINSTIAENGVSEIYLSKKDLILNNLIVEYQWTGKNIQLIPCNSIQEAKDKMKMSPRNKVLLHSKLYSHWPKAEDNRINFNPSSLVNDDYYVEIESSY
jgi:hypothetical protein